MQILTVNIMQCEIILASASPRRQELLKVVCDDFKVVPSLIEETVPQGTDALKVPEYLSFIKAKDVAKKFPEKIVIGADTCVILSGTVLGKPKTKEEAFSMLSALSGKTHLVVTGCTLISNEKTVTFSEITKVTFNCLSKSQITEYIKTDEPFDKAGGYGIQSKGALFVKKIDGDYFNVVGLPISRLNSELNKF